MVFTQWETVSITRCGSLPGRCRVPLGPWEQVPAQPSRGMVSFWPLGRSIVFGGSWGNPRIGAPGATSAGAASAGAGRA